MQHTHWPSRARLCVDHLLTSNAQAVHACRVCRLEGGKEHELLDGCTGTFFPKMLPEMFTTLGAARNIPVVINERLVYQWARTPHPTYGHLELWWANEHWWLGPASACGQSVGLLRLATPSPHPLGESWSLYCAEGQTWKVAGVKSTRVYEESEATEPKPKPTSEGAAGGAAGGGEKKRASSRLPTASARRRRSGGGAQGEEREGQMTEKEAQQWWNEELHAVKQLLGARSQQKRRHLQVHSARIAGKTCD